MAEMVALAFDHPQEVDRVLTDLVTEPRLVKQTTHQ